MAKLADAVHFDYIDELCEEILDRLNEDDEAFVSIIGTYEGIRAFIKEFMTYDEVEFESLVINDPEYNDYYDEYIVDIWNNDGEILFGCEPAKRDGRYLNCEGNVLYLLDDVKQAVLNTCEYDEKYFVIIGEDECDFDEECDCKCPCDCHKEEKEIAPTEKAHYSINGKPVSKAEFDKKYTELQKKAENLDISVASFYNCKNEYLEFLESLKNGKEVADYEVEDAKDIPKRFKSIQCGFDIGGNGLAYAITCTDEGYDGIQYKLKAQKKQAQTNIDQAIEKILNGGA